MADIFYRAVGNYSVLTTIPELAERLGSNLEPSPSRSPIGILGEGHSSLPLPVGASFYWYPNDRKELSRLLGIELETSSLQDSTGALSGVVVHDGDFAVPQTVTATQIRLWLFRHGVSLESVQSAIDSIQDPQVRGETQIQWEYAPYIERSHPLLDAIGAAVGLTSSQIDAAFVAASRL